MKIFGKKSFSLNLELKECLTFWRFCFKGNLVPRALFPGSGDEVVLKGFGEKLVCNSFHISHFHVC